MIPTFKNRLGLAFVLCMQLTISQAQEFPKDSSQIQNCVDCCCHQDLAPVGIMIGHVHGKRQWMLSYRMMFMSMKGNYENGKAITDDVLFNTYLMLPKSMNMQMHMLMGMVGITERLTLMAMLHFNHTNMTMQMPESSASAADGHNHDHGTGHDHDGMHMHSTGFGDTKLHALYAICKTNNHQFIASLGTSIPTGSITYHGHDAMYAGSRLPYAMQQGSGSVEVLPGITYLYAQNKFSGSAQALYTWRLNQNKIGYQLGNESLVNTWLAYRLHNKWSISVRAEWLHIAPLKDADIGLYKFMEPAANASNYGGNAGTGFLGINIFLNKQRLSLEAGLPVFQKWNGVQMHRTFAITAGWQFLF